MSGSATAAEPACLVASARSCAYCVASMPSMTVNLAGVTLRNPIVAASGTCGYVEDLASVLDPATIGAIVTKSITREPREGNPPWRIIDLPRTPGMLNAIGLANVGLKKF